MVIDVEISVREPLGKVALSRRLELKVASELDAPLLVAEIEGIFVVCTGYDPMDVGLPVEPLKFEVLMETRRLLVEIEDSWTVVPCSDEIDPLCRATPADSLVTEASVDIEGPLMSAGEDGLIEVDTDDGTLKEAKKVVPLEVKPVTDATEALTLLVSVKIDSVSALMLLDEMEVLIETITEFEDAPTMLLVA